jgi:pimeloyl-ACP methyl ester carboxylesterase
MGLEMADVGRGPAVMLVHGAPSSTADFDALVAALAADHRVLVPHLPGYGRSPRLDGAYSFARVHELIEAGVVARGIRALAIVGFSSGGHHALALACRRRIDVARVVSLAGFAAMTPADRDGLRGFAAMLSAPGADLASADMRAIARQRFLAPRFADDAVALARVDAWLEATTAPVLADELLAEAEADVRPQLVELAIPVVARVGELDAAVPPSYSEEIVATCPGARLELVRGHGHALLVEQPTETIAAIRAALADPSW